MNARAATIALALTASIAVAALIVSVTSAMAQSKGVCTAIYDPVCARRGAVMLTYSNACVAANDRAKVLARGACPPNCPAIYKPVCGEDAQGVRRNYGNECAAKADGAKIIRNRRCFFTFRGH